MSLLSVIIKKCVIMGGWRLRVHKMAEKGPPAAAPCQIGLKSALAVTNISKIMRKSRQQNWQGISVKLSFRPKTIAILNLIDSHKN